ncbi:hypothetical protein CapIbe_014178 [Capra ibex]
MSVPEKSRYDICISKTQGKLPKLELKFSTVKVTQGSYRGNWNWTPQVQGSLQIYSFILRVFLSFAKYF